MKRRALSAVLALCASVVLAEEPQPVAWRFAMVADTHVAPGATAIPSELVSAMLGETVELVLVAGDVVDAGRGASPAELRTQLDLFRTLTAPLAAAGIPVLPVRGNHEDDAPGNRAAWDEAFAGLVPANGPDGEVGLTYSFVHRNALFVGLDQYVRIHALHQDWLDGQLAANRLPHVFVFGHEPAFKASHADNLDDDAAGRDVFWNSLTRAGARVYLCGHDHFFDFARIDDGDGDETDDLHQAVVGTGGGRLFNRYAHDGDNSGFTPVGLHHESGHGYLLVEVSGDGSADLGVTLTWKRRTVDAATGAARYLPAYTFAYTAAAR